MTRTVLITGAGSGFGKAAAIELVARGHDVIATTETQEQADALAAEQPSLRTLKLDVPAAADVASAADLGVDVLINNAGVGVLGPPLLCQLSFAGGLEHGSLVPLEIGLHPLQRRNSGVKTGELLVYLVDYSYLFIRWPQSNGDLSHWPLR